MPIDADGEVGPAEQADVEQRMTSPQFNHRERGRRARRRPTMQPQTIGCVQPRTGASTTPNTNTATAPPISTAPTQSSGVAVSSRDDRIVHVQMNRAMPDAANA